MGILDDCLNVKPHQHRDHNLDRKRWSSVPYHCFMWDRTRSSRTTAPLSLSRLSLIFLHSCMTSNSPWASPKNDNVVWTRLKSSTWVEYPGLQVNTGDVTCRRRSSNGKCIFGNRRHATGWHEAGSSGANVPFELQVVAKLTQQFALPSTVCP